MANTSDYFSVQGHDPDSYIASDHEVLVVALDTNDAVYLTNEPSPAFDGQSVLILPGGTWTGRELAEATANRELQEEVGQRGQRFDQVGELLRWAKYLNARTLVYLVRDLSANRLQGDEHYQITTEQVPLAHFEDLIASGRLRDGASIAALYMTRAWLARERAGASAPDGAPR